MRRYFLCVLVVLLVIALTGCVPETYRLIQEDGNYYVIVNLPTDEPLDGSEQIWASCVVFSSVEEMVNDLRTGTFEAYELEALSQMITDDEGRIRLINLDHLYEPILPEDLTEYAVELYGGEYHFVFDMDSADRFRGRMLPLPRESFEYYISSEWCVSAPTISLSSEQANEIRNGLNIVLADPWRENLRSCCYIVQAESKTLYVAETFDSDYSQSVPSYIMIIGQESDTYYSIVLSYPSSRPTLEWLASFSLKEYGQ